MPNTASEFSGDVKKILLRFWREEVLYVMAELPIIVSCKNMKGKINLVDWLMYLRYSPAVIEVPTLRYCFVQTLRDDLRKTVFVWVFKILRQMY